MPDSSKPSPAVAPTKPQTEPAQSQQSAASTPASPTQPSLPNIPTGIFYVNYFDVITDGKVRALMALCSEILAKVKPTPTTLYFAISSPGGSVAAGITLYNFLRALPVKIIMHNTGSIDSIATVIFLAAAERYACSHSRFLFHGVATGEMPPGTRLNRFQTREFLSGLEQDEGRIKELIVERSIITESEMVQLFQQGETKNPAFALEKGIIHDVRDLTLPMGAQIVTANFQ
ncbi:MAG: ATP-dependent Clp protease, protease subunit [Verrucomicrobiota bacterium]|jgi:ATP-dependent protease ClpP protease subunit